MGCAPSVKVSKNIGIDKFKEGDYAQMNLKIPKKTNAFLSARPRTNMIFRKYQSKMVLIIEVPKED